MGSQYMIFFIVRQKQSEINSDSISLVCVSINKDLFICQIGLLLKSNIDKMQFPVNEMGSRCCTNSCVCVYVTFVFVMLLMVCDGYMVVSVLNTFGSTKQKHTLHSVPSFSLSHMPMFSCNICIYHL